MPAAYYPAVIDRSATGFGVTFPDFPGCIAAGDSPTAAALNAEAALALHVEGLAKDKDPLPGPSALDAIEAVDGAEDVARILVRVEAPSKVERVLISLDANLLRSIDAIAPNRSAWFADAARMCLATSKYVHIDPVIQEDVYSAISATMVARVGTMPTQAGGGIRAGGIVEGGIAAGGPRPDPIKRKKRALG